MPRPLSWLPRLAEIRHSVEGSNRSHYDRPAIERLFQLQPRAAGRLMVVLPKVQALGRSQLVERGALSRFLEQVQEAEDPARVVAARRATVSRRKPRVLVRRELLEETRLAELPKAVTLERGRLEIRFATLVEMVELLAMVAAAIANDEAGFAERVELPRMAVAEQDKRAEERRDVDILFAELRQMEAGQQGKLAPKNADGFGPHGYRAEATVSRIPHSPPD